MTTEAQTLALLTRLVVAAERIADAMAPAEAPEDEAPVEAPKYRPRLTAAGAADVQRALRKAGIRR